MKVTLIQSSDYGCATGEEAAAICVGKDKSRVHGRKNGLTVAVESGHLSVLEHTYFTWKIEGISRACTHQLVRHRIASYSQQSQRYCKVDVSTQDWYVTPTSISKDNTVKAQYDNAMQFVASAYNYLVVAGMPEEDARMILPNACTTTILVSMNARAFIEAAEKRLCNRAQWEIREVFREMRKLIGDSHPMVAKFAVPKCLKHVCIEKKPCGKPVDLEVYI